ncbi:Amino acid transporter [Halopenitus malekzadehii]|uniref:Amino acid transporter n=1 Tax=Halopenitus malekzadehii TaxID=1267564 RepID=A0A1H6IMK5_9EURY|nr:APC family permease [Halopenitus malekzadehii]SEH50309.1 Amino acid transporter [Halopenitus malekzadehii]
MGRDDVLEGTPPTDSSEPVVEHDRDRGEGELERTIGLVGGLAIGIGTMIGAGIFVFPGLAAENAGPAASLSFAIGAVVALLVALPLSELATAMPRSGGGYFFISRGLGTGPGAVIGIGLWLGLVFAAAFYLVGLGSYAGQVFAEAGIALPVDPAVPLGIAFGVALTVLSVFGTENTASLQNAIVIVLLVILTLFLSYGSLDALGVFGTESTPERFLPPGGMMPVLQTAALVFTSYLGFAQVATVAGDITNPSRNLPLAMVGSVLVVGVFYVVTIFVATSAFGSVRLGEFGETAMVEVARAFVGLPGALAIVVAGLLATFSSANASILSASRAVYAVSRDDLLPASASRLNLRYGTPHVALGLAGGPIVVLTATGQVELLAEVASVLHLVMYGLVCVALIQLRRESPEWYTPSFRCPAGYLVAGLGALASLSLIAFMQPASIGVGAAVMIAAYAWYRYYATDVALKGAF